LSRRRLIAGAFLSVVAYVGYYSAYGFVIWRTVTGVYTIGLWYLLSGAILQASNNLQQIFSTLSGIADQALFLTDLLAFFDMQPTIRSSRTRCLRRGRLFVDLNSATFPFAILEARGWC
jgi:ATP-binding cassette subfamily B protein